MAEKKVAVAEKIKRARSHRRPSLNQQQFAEVTGITRATLSRYETGAAVPEPALRQIAERLGLPVWWFLDGTDSPPPYGMVSIVENEVAKGVNPATIGSTVAIPLWMGVVAGKGGESHFEPDEGGMQEVPILLLGGHDPAVCRVFKVAGSSMSPRVEHSQLGIAVLSPDAPINTLVMARRSDGALFVKALRPGTPPQPYALHSVNSEAYPPIVDVDGWQIVGSVIAFMAPPVAGDRNIEWNFGLPLRA